MTIKINKLRLYARHGVMPQELTVGNTFEVSVTLECDATSAILHDDLDGTVNYARVIDIIRAQMAVPSRLLEHVAARIARAIRDEFPSVTAGTVELLKLTPPCGVEVGSVGVELRF